MKINYYYPIKKNGKYIRSEEMKTIDVDKGDDSPTRLDLIFEGAKLLIIEQISKNNRIKEGFKLIKRIDNMLDNAFEHINGVDTENSKNPDLKDLSSEISSDFSEYMNYDVK